MKQRNKLAVLLFIGISFFCLLGMPCKNSLADQKQLSFEKDKNYDIYYQVENHTQYITNVKIIDTVTMAGVAFLEIKGSNLVDENDGYVSVTSIIAILPAGAPRPQLN